MTLLSILTNFINLSLQAAWMPAQLKEAMVKPKVKKDSLDPEQYSNFRPTSNLKFVSKITEKATVAYQLKDYLTDNNLEEPIQSAYQRLQPEKTLLRQAAFRPVKPNWQESRTRKTTELKLFARARELAYSDLLVEVIDGKTAIR